MLKFMNGCKAPGFFIRNEDGTNVEPLIEFSLKYKKLLHYSDVYLITDELIDKSVLQTPDCVINLYFFDLSEKTEKDNVKKLKKIINYALEKKRIFIVPYLDCPSLIEEVVINVDEKNRARFQIANYINQPYSTGNTGLAIEFRSKERQNSINWVDPDEINTITTRYGKHIR